jgi:tRNA-specific 2-thiouridylase
MSERGKVVVAMSGGVDSSVAAGLLREHGYDVVGLFMRTGVEAPAEREAPRAAQGCCAARHAEDAELVARRLGIRFHAFDLPVEFDAIIDYFAAEYAAGRTPNPCALCNARVKFGTLFEHADAIGAQYVATGHYARIEPRSGQRALCRGVDRVKDQSYALFGLHCSSLERILFPVGGLTKERVRAEASRLGLPVHEKPDSVEICFVPDDDYARLVRERRPDAFRPGDVVDESGRIRGRHRGVPHYTIGQRRGLGIAAGKPIYVTRINAETNTVTVGDADALLSRGLIAANTNFLANVPATFRATVQIRYQHEGAAATVERIAKESARITFDVPQRAVAPGQAAVFYDGDVVIGGGWIQESLGR